MIVSFKQFWYVLSSNFIPFLAIIIGFTNTSYTVREGIGNLQVDVQVLNIPDNQPLPASVDLVIQTVSGSASKFTKPVYLKILMLHVLLSWRK